MLWYVMSCINFIMQLDAEAVASMPETHRAIVDGRPMWATAGFAVAAFGGAIACLLLLLRKSASFYLFTVSLLGVILVMVHTVGIVGPTIDFSVFEIVMMIVMPVVVAAFLVWYSKWAERRRWIG